MKINIFGKEKNIPEEVSRVTKTLENAGFEAFLVGGCVRDILLENKPKDWDITTDATPEQIIPLFLKTFYENSFGTVAVVNENTEDETLKTIEITPYRIEFKYSDLRHPDSVVFSKNIEDDLKRRDFTINSMALSIKDGVSHESQIIDLFNGRLDILNKIIQTVGNPDDRFKEDALRMLRAIRLSAELDFKIDEKTQKSIKDNKNLLKKISHERIRDEFIKIIMSDNPMNTLILANNLGILGILIPELEKTIGVDQKGAHIYDVWEHSLRSLQTAADKKWPLEIRLSALFHDISKPETRKISHETNQYTFYGHEIVGSRVTSKILQRLRFPVKTIEKVAKMIRWHMFFSDTEQITLSAVRRMISNVGKENIWDLMNLRICDRKGMGRPKEDPYRLRKYKSMVEEAMHDPISVGMLKIDGKKIIEKTHETPGPRIGYILHVLLNNVLDDPKLNNEEYLISKSLELSKLKDIELKKIGEESKNKKDDKEAENIDKIRGKFHVR